MQRDSLILLMGALIAFVLQVVVAPNIAFFQAMPNFLLIYIVVLAIVRPSHNSTLILAFFFGLGYDFMGHGPVGAMAFLMVLAAFVVSRLFAILHNPSFAMSAFILVASFVLTECLYAVFLLIFGYPVGLFDAFIFRALPCALYDSIFGLIIYAVSLRLFAGTTSSGGSDPSAKSSFVGKARSSRLSKKQRKKMHF